jgi:4-hydroxy-tetrahydrodipicolinate synthase
MNTIDAAPGRRHFLKVLGAGALGLAWSGHTAAAAERGSKPLNGLFPIAQTPFTESNQLDLDCLQAEVKFCNRGRVHGFVWPQIASGWSTLSEKERLDGAEAILAAGKEGSTALVIGVQAATIDKALQYARHAEQHGADGIVSLPPAGVTDEKALLSYYKQIGDATPLPLFVQSQGDMSVDLIVEMFKSIPTMRVVKDEAGVPLERITEILERTSGKLAVFSGNGVRTMIDEMRLGFVGHCPTTGLADVYQSAWDLWHEGKHREAFDMFGRILAFESFPGAGNYILVARGVFKETTKSRPMPGMGSGGGRGARREPALDEREKQVIRDALNTYLKPYLRA